VPSRPRALNRPQRHSRPVYPRRAAPHVLTRLSDTRGATAEGLFDGSRLTRAEFHPPPRSYRYLGVTWRGEEGKGRKRFRIRSPSSGVPLFRVDFRDSSLRSPERGRSRVMTFPLCFPLARQELSSCSRDCISFPRPPFNPSFRPATLPPLPIRFPSHLAIFAPLLTPRFIARCN